MFEYMKYFGASGYFKLFVIIWLTTILVVLIYPANQINQINSRKLIYKINPKTIWFFALFPEFCGLLFLTLPLILPSMTTLACHHNIEATSINNYENKTAIVECNIIEEYQLGRIKNIPISQLKKAILDEKINKDKDILYQIYLLSEADKKIPLYWQGDLKRKSFEKIIEQINSFIVKPQNNTLIIKQDDRANSFVFVLGSFFLLVTLLIILFAPIRYIIFDLDSESLIDRKKILFLINTSTTKLNLKDITQATVEATETSETSRITLLLNSGDNFPLTFGYDSGTGKSEISRLINRFLARSYDANKLNNVKND